MFLPLTELQPMGGMPGLDLNEIMGVMAKFMLASVRIGAFFVVAPIFGSATIPVQVRVVMAAMLAIIVMAYTEVPAIESFGELRIIGVLITDHQSREVLDTCEYSYIMHAGEIISEGTSDHIISDQDARKFYLGQSFKV